MDNFHKRSVHVSAVFFGDLQKFVAQVQYKLETNDEDLVKEKVKDEVPNWSYHGNKEFHHHNRIRQLTLLNSRAWIQTLDLAAESKSFVMRPMDAFYTYTGLVMMWIRNLNGDGWDNGVNNITDEDLNGNIDGFLPDYKMDFNWLNAMYFKYTGISFPTPSLLLDRVRNTVKYFVGRTFSKNEAEDIYTTCFDDARPSGISSTKGCWHANSINDLESAWAYHQTSFLAKYHEETECHDHHMLLAWVRKMAATPSDIVWEHHNSIAHDGTALVESPVSAVFNAVPQGNRLSFLKPTQLFSKENMFEQWACHFKARHLNKVLKKRYTNQRSYLHAQLNFLLQIAALRDGDVSYFATSWLDECLKYAPMRTDMLTVYSILHLASAVHQTYNLFEMPRLYAKLPYQAFLQLVLRSPFSFQEVSDEEVWLLQQLQLEVSSPVFPEQRRRVSVDDLHLFLHQGDLTIFKNFKKESGRPRSASLPVELQQAPPIGDDVDEEKESGILAYSDDFYWELFEIRDSTQANQDPRDQDPRAKMFDFRYWVNYIGEQIAYVGGKIQWPHFLCLQTFIGDVFESSLSSQATWKQYFGTRLSYPSLNWGNAYDTFRYPFAVSQELFMGRLAQKIKLNQLEITVALRYWAQHCERYAAPAVMRLLDTRVARHNLQGRTYTFNSTICWQKDNILPISRVDMAEYQFLHNNHEMSGAYKAVKSAVFKSDCRVDDPVASVDIPQGTGDGMPLINLTDDTRPRVGSVVAGGLSPENIARGLAVDGPKEPDYDRLIQLANKKKYRNEKQNLHPVQGKDGFATDLFLRWILMDRYLSKAGFSMRTKYSTHEHAMVRIAADASANATSSSQPRKSRPIFSRKSEPLQQCKVNHWLMGSEPEEEARQRRIPTGMAAAVSANKEPLVEYREWLRENRPRTGLIASCEPLEYERPVLSDFSGNAGVDDIDLERDVVLPEALPLKDGIDEDTIANNLCKQFQPRPKIDPGIGSQFLALCNELAPHFSVDNAVTAKDLQLILREYELYFVEEQIKAYFRNEAAAIGFDPTQDQDLAVPLDNFLYDTVSNGIKRAANKTAAGVKVYALARDAFVQRDDPTGTVYRILNDRLTNQWQPADYLAPPDEGILHIPGEQPLLIPRGILKDLLEIDFLPGFIRNQLSEEQCVQSLHIAGSASFALDALMIRLCEVQIFWEQYSIEHAMGSVSENRRKVMWAVLQTTMDRAIKAQLNMSSILNAVEQSAWSKSTLT